MRWNYERKNKDCGYQIKGHIILRYCSNPVYYCPLNAVYSLSA